MKVVLAGAYGNLGSHILKELVKQGHEVIASDMIERDIEGLDKSKYTFRKLDVTNAESLVGLCDGADALVTTVGLTKASPTITNEQIDYQGNLNLLNECKRAGVKKYVYISVIRSQEADESIPMVYWKGQLENELMKSGISYVIHRPTGYFYDIIHVFRPMIEKGKVSLLGKKPVSANVISCENFAEFIVNHIEDDNKIYNVGGKETYTYEEIARMCFEAAGKKPVIKRAPAWLFDVLASLPKIKKEGKAPIIRFSKFTLTRDMVGDTAYGEDSFKEYIQAAFKGE